ncbi:hypothetical protein DSO57_1031591 [Entomophthora muscae]|uniref:Uncharacterized protein n=2 Tax=Entomophthora muscae TaxID=34485 RepID=A0ACC2TN02_9FUNG|nr:hypothetical protein DSO57_1028768 [Entomophthora muscae]KAJ9075867.1 hypothetical protein DSO57_1031591 [Entomophthora muscae]
MTKGQKVSEFQFNQGINYKWRQTLREVEVVIPLKAGTRARDLLIVFYNKKIKAAYKLGGDVLLEGTLNNKVCVDDCTWNIEGSFVVITLEKFSRIEWWDSVVKGHPTIDVTRIEPENSSLKNLDNETRAMVEKIMFDQRQRMMSLPDSEALSKQEAFKNFKNSHPEMDFSQAKIA